MYPPRLTTDKCPSMQLLPHELNTLLGPLHYDIASESITPAEGEEQFIALVQDFLSSKQEFAMKRNGQAGYIEHASNTLKKARSVKNALRKKAFGSNATDEDRKAFRLAVKAHNYLKRMDDNKRKSRTSRHHEKQYHKNFWKFSKQCVNGNIGQSNVSPTFDANLANQYFPQKYSTPNPIVIDKLSWFSNLPVQLDARIGFNLDPVRPRDIRLILKNKKATSAPGPDGLMYGIFRKLPATHRFLATLFSKLLVTGDPPSSWSKSEVTLIYKAGDTDKPENFRMISLTSCVGKLFHQILSDRIANYFLRNKLIDPETQKAFLKGINGCMEHTFVMNELLANARNKKRTFHATFFDLADAFGSVEHNLIHYTMKRNRIPDPVCLYVENLYSRLQGEIRGPGWRSDPFSFRRGVFQGDPLSPIIFVIVFDPIIQYFKLKETTHGYSLEGKSYITLPFADDFCLLTADKRKHQKLMTEVLDLIQSMNLTLKPVKCKTLSIRSGSPDVCTFFIGETILKSLKDIPEKFLGSLITFKGKTKDTFDYVKSKLCSIIKNVDASMIRDEFKLRVYVNYAAPSLRFMLTVHELCDTQLELLDHIHTNAIKKWLGLAIHGATPAFIHSLEGLALPRLSDIYLESHTLAYARCMVKADSRVTHALQCKLERESRWIRKMGKMGSRKWHQIYTATSLKLEQLIWPRLKTELKNIIHDDRLNLWRNYINPLVQQGNLLKLMHAK